MTSDFDYDAEDVAPVVGDNALAQLTHLADEQMDAQNDIARLEEQLKKAKERLRDVQEFKLPQLMDEIGMSEFSTASGLQIKIKEKIRAGISEERKPLAFAWLEEHNCGGLIKRQFVIEFGKAEEKWANKFEADLRKRKKPLAVKRKKDIHHSTLTSWVTEQLEAGVDIPLDTFGVMRQRIANVKIKD